VKMTGSMLVQTLVVVANVQMRTLKTKVGNHENSNLDKGYSILRHSEIPCTMRACSQLPKGKVVNIPLAGCGYCGSTNNPGNVKRKS